MAAVAQLVEPRIVIPVVAGSSPVGRPNFSLRMVVGNSRTQNPDQRNLRVKPVLIFRFFPDQRNLRVKPVLIFRFLFPGSAESPRKTSFDF
jgi:hypothetical protein